MITHLELGITDGVSVSWPWRLAGDTLYITCNFLYCNHQVHRDFLITLYIVTQCGILDNKQERQFTYNAILRRVVATIVAVEKQEVLHILGVYAALVTQHTKRMHRTIFSSLASQAV
jgi:hypothetical protein